MARDAREHSPAPTSATVSDGRYIYNSNVVGDQRDAASEQPNRANRKAVQRRHSTFNIVSGLFLIATASLLYTGNVIMVNQLMKEVNDLNNRCNAIVSGNEVLRAEIARKSSLDRISTLATEEVGLTNPKEPPVWFEVDEEKIQELAKK